MSYGHHQRNGCGCKKRVCGCEKPRYRNSHGPECGCKSCRPRKMVIQWPPRFREDGYSHIIVPGDFNCVESALRAIKITQLRLENKTLYENDKCEGLGQKASTKGYVVHLAPGRVHTVYGDYDTDLKFLRIVGDYSSVKGVGYYHKLARWGDYPTFSEQYDFCTGGLGEFELRVECRTIKVNACKNPNYNSLQCGDTLVFMHRTGKMTCHRIKCGNENEIILYDPIDLCGKCVVKGEGFYIKPNTTLKFCSRNCPSQKMMVQHRIEFAGLVVDLGNDLIFGATGGHTEIEHSVIQGKCGKLIHIGKADWYKPNVFTNELVVNDSSNGTMMLQTFVGCRAQSTFHSNPDTQFWFNVFNKNKIGVNLLNGGRVSTTSSDFCDCDFGVLMSSGSKASLTKTRFRGCGTALDGTQNTNSSSLPISGIRGGQEIIFEGNEIAMQFAYHHNHIMKDVKVSGNTTDLILLPLITGGPPADIFNNLSGYTSGTPGPGQTGTVVFYDKIL